jgi:uncharacterized protein YjbI with pentapeptide repeats
MTYNITIQKKTLKVVAIALAIVLLSSTNFVSYWYGSSNQKTVTETITETVTNTEIIYRPQEVNGSNLEFHNVALQKSVLASSLFTETTLLGCYIMEKSIVKNSVINGSTVVDSVIENCTLIDSVLYLCVISDEYAEGSTFKNCSRPIGYSL